MAELYYLIYSQSMCQPINHEFYSSKGQNILKSLGLKYSILVHTILVSKKGLEAADSVSCFCLFVYVLPVSSPLTPSLSFSYPPSPLALHPLPLSSSAFHWAMPQHGVPHQIQTPQDFSASEAVRTNFVYLINYPASGMPLLQHTHTPKDEDTF